jgi:hypothetical protein
LGCEFLPRLSHRRHGPNWVGTWFRDPPFRSACSRSHSTRSQGGRCSPPPGRCRSWSVPNAEPEAAKQLIAGGARIGPLAWCEVNMRQPQMVWGVSPTQRLAQGRERALAPWRDAGSAPLRMPRANHSHTPTQTTTTTLKILQSLLLLRALVWTSRSNTSTQIRMTIKETRRIGDRVGVGLDASGPCK